jgi:hypothetical protein
VAIEIFRNQLKISAVKKIWRKLSVWRTQEESNELNGCQHLDRASVQNKAPIEDGAVKSFAKILEFGPQQSVHFRAASDARNRCAFLQSEKDQQKGRQEQGPIGQAYRQ